MYGDVTNGSPTTVARELPVTTASLKMYRDRTVFKVSRAMGGGGGE